MTPNYIESRGTNATIYKNKKKDMGHLHEPGPWLVDGRDECNATTGTRAPGVHNGRVARLAVVRGGQVDARRGGGAPTTAPSARGLDDGVGAGHGQDLPGLLQG